MSEDNTVPSGEQDPHAAQPDFTGNGEEGPDSSPESGEAVTGSAPSPESAEGPEGAPDAADSGTPEVPADVQIPKEADLLSEIVSLPPVRALEIAAKPSEGLGARFGRWFIYALLIILIALPLLLRRPLLSRDVSVDLHTLALSESIESLDSGSVVLVAFDYDPTTSGEMDLVARAIVGHVMDRGAQVVAVSLLPAGAATAQDLLDILAREREHYREGYGQSYVNLGFVPGQAAAVRLLAQSLEAAAPSDFFGTPLSEASITQGLYGVRSFDLIVELAAAPDPMRWWIEQAGAPFGVPVGAGVSASVAPWARPYFETDPKLLVGLLGGESDAAMYAALLQGQDRLSGPVAVRLDSQLAGHVLLFGLILVGNVAYLIRRSKGRSD